MSRPFRMAGSWSAALMSVAACTATPPALKPATELAGTGSPVIVTREEQIQAIKDTVSAAQGLSRKMSGGGASALNSAPGGLKDSGTSALNNTAALNNTSALNNTAARRILAADVAGRLTQAAATWKADASASFSVDYDATTRQITALSGSDWRIGIGIEGGGTPARRAQASLQNLPDNSKFDLALGIRADTWTAFPFGVETATDGSTSSVMPFELFYNQLPDLGTLQQVSVDAGVLFGGDADKSASLKVVAEDFKVATGVLADSTSPDASASTAAAPLRLPHRFSVRMTSSGNDLVMAMSMKPTDTYVEMDMKGTVALKMPNGKALEWTVANRIQIDPKREASDRLEVDWTLPAKSIRFTGTGTAAPDGTVTIDGRFVSTIDGAELGRTRYTTTEKDASGGLLSPKVLFPDASTLELKGSDFVDLGPYADKPATGSLSPIEPATTSAN